MGRMGRMGRTNPGNVTKKMNERMNEHALLSFTNAVSWSREEHCLPLRPVVDIARKTCALIRRCSVTFSFGDMCRFSRKEGEG